MMLASGPSSVMTRLVGRTTSELGAIPMVHIMLAPMQTCIGIYGPLAQLAARHFNKTKIECNCGTPAHHRHDAAVSNPSFRTILGNPTVNPAKDLSNLVVSFRILHY